jgi:Uma2 family endonuclease
MTRRAAMDAQLQHTEIVAAVPETLTFQAYLNAHDSFEGGRTEWLAGEVAIYNKSNNEKHQALLLLLAILFEWFLKKHDAGRVYMAGYPMYLGDTAPAREPDLMVVLTAHEDRITPTYLNGLADIVIEVISPESVGRDRGVKFAEYEAAGVPEYWLVDPIRNEVLVYALHADGLYRAVLRDAQGRLRSAVLPGLALDPAVLWRDPLPRGPEVSALIEQMA